ncbi:hypothetical protein EDI_206990 [Entamoeba dispar SAW760]|uniref:Smr domain-containing protein n=1 Tax=Entamoeba dispar (strain ATCC PRA-260 / SAW760) TaxID=370354 RepID=B0EL63_ENTDS|nr:uncharacterized protein EDI_206990 [Entamoeba dispar SAW760]EDR24751.1 hypothetical protein EDI_206990 [Entamoeba dispar SAW760]|eukprot:EDR24751.1 hypothetical protein EDI_206990 [Entamoeba dispar SAW760]
MGCFGSKPKKESNENNKPKVEKKTTTEMKQADNKPKDQKVDTKTTNNNKPAEGTHVPKPKGDAPVIEDRPNGKKEVVSGDKSILLDEIYKKHYAGVDKAHDEVEEAKQAWLAAKEKKDPNTQKLNQVFQDKKANFEKVKEQAHRAAFKEVQIYMVDEDAIDLHGLQIEGAIMMMKEEVAARRKAGKKILKIQCGMGHHNTVGYSKIKEEVVKQLKEMGEKFTEDKDHGFVNVEL